MWNYLSRINKLINYLHSNGFSPVCVRMCIFKLAFLAYFFPHTSHEYLLGSSTIIVVWLRCASNRAAAGVRVRYSGNAWVCVLTDLVVTAFFRASTRSIFAKPDWKNDKSQFSWRRWYNLLLLLSSSSPSSLNLARFVTAPRSSWSWNNPIGFGGRVGQVEAVCDVDYLGG